MNAPAVEAVLVVRSFQTGRGRRWRLSCSLCGPLAEGRYTPEEYLPAARSHVEARHDGRGRLVNADEVLVRRLNRRP